MIEYVHETCSTNADLIDRAQSGAYLAEGFWLVADRQTAGKGRKGRGWLDHEGNFMGSTLVTQRAGDPAPQTLALVAGIALHEVASCYLSSPHCLQLKWPNDVMAGSAKLAGILLEMVNDTVIVGIGVNLVSAPQIEGCDTVALAQIGHPPVRDVFADVLASAFALHLERWRTYGLGPVLTRWCSIAHPLGTVLRTCGSDGQDITGTFAGLADDGALQLQLPDGVLYTVHAGEVLFE